MSTLVTRMPTPRQLVEVLFIERDDRFYCRLCSASRAKPRNGGFTNIVDHLHRAHEDGFLDEYNVLVRQPNTLRDYVRVTVDQHALNVYHWIEWVVMDHHEISFCEKRLSRKYSNLDPIGAVTFKRYMEAVEDAVADRIRERLTGQPLGLLIDAWTEASTHYAAVIAVTPSLTNSSENDKSSPPPCRATSSRSFGGHLDQGQCSDGKAQRHQKPPSLAPGWSVDACAAQHHALGKHIEEFVDHSDPKLFDVLLSPRERTQLQALSDDLKNLESVSTRLQAGGQDQRELSLHEVRLLFDRVIQLFPVTAKYLSPTSTNVVKAPHFEVGIVKVLSGHEHRLTPAETNALRRLVKVEEPREADERELSFAERVLRDSTRQPSSRYMDLQWIPGTSNEVERLFSRAGRVWTPGRRAMHPTTLETLLFLEYNRVMWDAHLVANAIRRGERHVRPRVI